jgi:TP901 family phage tail tape measure protein
MSAIFAKMGKAAQGFDGRMDRTRASLDRMQTRLQTTGARMANFQTALAGLGAGAVIKNAIGQSNAFGESLAAIGTLIPGQEARLISLKETIGDVAVSAGKDLTDIAGGAFQVISAFGDMAGETEGRLAAVAKAAVAGGSSTESALSLLSAVTKGYGDTSAVALTKASDLAFMTNVLGQTTFPELAGAMGRVVPLAAQLNVSQEEMFAGFAALTGVTGNTSEVSTQLSAVLAAMLKPTADMTQAANALGFTSSAAMIKAEGLSSTLSMLMEHTKGDEQAIGKLLGRKEALTGMFALAGSQVDKFNTSIGAMKEAAASGGQVTEDAFQAIANGINKSGFEMKQFQVRMQSLKATIGVFAAEVLGPLAVRLTTLLGNLQENHPWLLKMATVGLLLLTAIAGIMVPLGLMISSFGSLLGIVKKLTLITKLYTTAQAFFAGVMGTSGVAVANTTGATVAYTIGAKVAAAAQWIWNAAVAAFPVIAIIMGILALIAIVILLVKNWDKVKKFFVKTFRTIRDWLFKAWDWFSALLDNPLWAALSYIFLPFITIPALIVKHWSKIVGFFARIWARVRDTVVGVVTYILDKLRPVWEWFSNFIDNPFFAALSYIFLPFITMPSLIVKHWGPIKTFFAAFWQGLLTGLRATVGIMKTVFFTFADYLLTVYGSIAEVIINTAARIGSAMGIQTEGLEAIVGKIRSVRASVRAQSAFGAGADEVAPMAPIPGAPGGPVRAEASVSVYTEKGIGVEPFAARGNLGYNMAGSYTH